MVKELLVLLHRLAVLVADPMKEEVFALKHRLAVLVADPRKELLALEHRQAVLVADLRKVAEPLRLRVEVVVGHRGAPRVAGNRDDAVLHGLGGRGDLDATDGSGAWDALVYAARHPSCGAWDHPTTIVPDMAES